MRLMLLNERECGLLRVTSVAERYVGMQQMAASRDEPAIRKLAENDVTWQDIQRKLGMKVKI